MILLSDQTADRRGRAANPRRSPPASASAPTAPSAARRARSGSSRAPQPQTGANVERPNRIGDGDHLAHTAHEEAVDVAEGTEQVAVVVVTRREKRDAQRVGGDGAVNVGMNHVRVEQVGAFAAQGAEDACREQRRSIVTAANASPRDPAGSQRRVEALCVATCVERQEPRVDAALAQCR